MTQGSLPGEISDIECATRGAWPSLLLLPRFTVNREDRRRDKAVLSIYVKRDVRQGWDMPRALRIEYPGEIDHVMNRAARLGEIFRNDTDRGFSLG